MRPTTRRCNVFRPGLPTAMDNPYPIEFVDEGDRILMRLEEWDGVRTIFLDPDSVGEPIQPRMGVSIGSHRRPNALD